MEKKPIKRNEHIIQLSKDHHFSLLFCWKVRTGVKLNIDMERIKKYVQYFWNNHIQPHFNEEETILFAPVKDAAVQKALDEHAGIKKRVNEIITSAKVNDADLLKLADAVESHVRYEERELFPHLENILTENQLQNIGRQLQQTQDAVSTDAFTDEFWIKK
jgi:hemerythrin-like domain-containing protein